MNDIMMTFNYFLLFKYFLHKCCYFYRFKSNEIITHAEQNVTNKLSWGDLFPQVNMTITLLYLIDYQYRMNENIILYS